jgi:hypothetical protein
MVAMLQPYAIRLRFPIELAFRALGMLKKISNLEDESIGGCKLGSHKSSRTKQYPCVEGLIISMGRTTTVAKT